MPPVSSHNLLPHPPTSRTLSLSLTLCLPITLYLVKWCDLYLIEGLPSMLPKNLPGCLYTPEFLITEPQCCTIRLREVKVKLSLWRDEGIWWRGVRAPFSLNVGTRRGWVVSFTFLPLYHKGYHKGKSRVEGWVSSRADLDDWGEKKSLAPFWNRTTTLRWSPLFLFLCPASLIFFLFILSVALHFLVAFFLYVTRPPSDWLKWQTDWRMTKATLRLPWLRRQHLHLKYR